VIPPDRSAAFVAAMEDVLDVYKRPYDPFHPVVAVDEKPVQLTAHAHDPLPPRPGDVAKEDHEYRRAGTANLFVAFEPLAGWRRYKVTERRARPDFAHFVRDLLDGPYRYAAKVVLVMDNLNTHSTASLYAAFAPAEARRLADRLEVHHTPKHGSWLNVAEIDLSALGKRLPDRLDDIATLARHAAAVEADRNEAKKGCCWRFTTADARIKLANLYPAIQER
jgi:hypothetical protein